MYSDNYANITLLVITLGTVLVVLLYPSLSHQYVLRSAQNVHCILANKKGIEDCNPFSTLHRDFFLFSSILLYSSVFVSNIHDDESLESGKDSMLPEMLPESGKI